MKYILSLLFILGIISPCYATKTYYSASKNLRIDDGTERKTISQLQQEFNCNDLVDITAQVNSKASADKLAAQQRATVNALTQQQAVTAIKTKLGLTDTDMQNLRTALERTDNRQ